LPALLFSRSAFSKAEKQAKNRGMRNASMKALEVELYLLVVLLSICPVDHDNLAAVKSKSVAHLLYERIRQRHG